MSDFLHSIRNRNNNNDKSYNQNQRSSRPYDNGNSYNRNNDRKFRPKNDYNQQRDETMNRIKDALESIAANQLALIEVADRRALAEERKADAIEHIASVIGSFPGLGNQLFDNGPVEAAPVCESVVEEEVVEEPVVEAAFVQKEKAKAKRTSVRKTAAKKAPAKEKKSAKASADMDKDEIMALIHKMRKKGDTYNEIAANLTAMNLPTFSGRGKWHAQTIHRLCQLG